MNVKRRLLLLAGGLLVAGGSLGLRQGPGGGQPGGGQPTEVYDYRGAQFSGPGYFDQAELAQLSEDYLNGRTLPVGYAFVELDGEVNAVLTGVANRATGEKQLVVTVNDEAADLEVARLYDNGSLEDTATRANGGIVDFLDYSTATLTGWIPASAPYNIRSEWEYADGTLRVHNAAVLP